jgi:hypothetical protein
MVNWDYLIKNNHSPSPNHPNHSLDNLNLVLLQVRTELRIFELY